MTDKADIAMLRAECAQWVKETFGESIDTRMALNGDGNDYMQFDMAAIWKAWHHLSGKRQRADTNEPVRCEGVPQHVHDMIDLQETIDEFRQEVAALKGEQVPVAYLYSASFERGEVEGQLTDAPGCDMPVYDRPQKPVVTNEMALAFHFATTDGAAADDDVEDIKTGLRAALSASEITNAPVVLNEVLTAVSIGGSRTELIDALTAIKPKFGAPGSRDVEVRAARDAIDKAIEKLSNL